MSEKKIVIGSLQPDIEDILKWNDLSDTDFQKADAAEKEDFIPQRSSISYWADAWRRLRKHTVAHFLGRPTEIGRGHGGKKSRRSSGCCPG